MHSEGFAVNQIHVMEPWPDEPSEEAGLAWARSGLESACGINRLRKLPPSPFRSVGGYLDYAEWPDCQRFMELDRLIQVYALESQNPPRGADSGDSQVCPLERHPETLGDRYQRRKISFSEADYADKKCTEHWTGPSFADVLGRLENRPIRRL